MDDYDKKIEMIARVSYTGDPSRSVDVAEAHCSRWAYGSSTREHDLVEIYVYGNSPVSDEPYACLCINEHGEAGTGHDMFSGDDDEVLARYRGLIAGPDDAVLAEGRALEAAISWFLDNAESFGEPVYGTDDLERRVSAHGCSLSSFEYDVKLSY